MQGVIVFRDGTPTAVMSAVMMRAMDELADEKRLKAGYGGAMFGQVAGWEGWMGMPVRPPPKRETEGEDAD